MEKLGMLDKIDILFKKHEEDIGERKEVKKKKIKIPRKAKVRKSKAKKGWIGIIKIDENGIFSGEKQQFEDSSYELKNGTYHASDGSEIGSWEGKYPVLIQQTWKVNPLKIKNEGEKNQTYGQKYIKAKMLADIIKPKRSGGSAILWIIVVVGILVGINYFMGGGAA